MIKVLRKIIINADELCWGGDKKHSFLKNMDYRKTSFIAHIYFDAYDVYRTDFDYNTLEYLEVLKQENLKALLENFLIPGFYFVNNSCFNNHVLVYNEIKNKFYYWFIERNIDENAYDNAINNMKREYKFENFINNIIKSKSEKISIKTKLI